MPDRESPREKLAGAHAGAGGREDHEALLWEQIAREELDADFALHVFAVEKKPRTRRLA
jgi:hypothetical protein